MPPKAKANTSSSSSDTAISMKDAQWLFTALQHNTTTAVINIQTASHALSTKPHNITCKLSDLRKRYGLNIAGTSVGNGNAAAGVKHTTANTNANGVGVGAGAKMEIRQTDIEWLGKVMRHCGGAVTINITSVALALATRPHNVTCKISALRKAYGLNLRGTSAGSAVAPPATAIVAAGSGSGSTAAATASGPSNTRRQNATAAAGRKTQTGRIVKKKPKTKGTAGLDRTRALRIRTDLDNVLADGDSDEIVDDDVFESESEDAD